MELGKIPHHSHHKIILFFTLVAGLLLRCYQLGAEGFWLDEIFSIVASKIKLTTLLTHLNIDVHPPFFHLAVKGWMAFGFHGETGIRLLSVLIGILACFFIYRFGTLLYSRQAGLAAAVILAFSAYHVRYSQELRDYELLSLLSLLSFYFFEKTSRNPVFRNYAGYFLSSCLLIYTHTFGFLTLFAQFVFYVISFTFLRKTWPRPSLPSWIATQVILLFSILPWLQTMAYQSQFLKNDQWLPPPKITSLVTVCKYYTGSWLLLALTTALIFYSCYLILKNKKTAAQAESVSAAWPARIHLLLMIWIGAGILLPFIASFIRSPVFLARRMIFASIPIYLLAGWAFSVLPSKKIKSFFILLFFIFSFFSLSEFYQRPFKEQWREAAQFVDQKAEAQDLLLFHTAFPQIGFDFYSKRPEIERRGFPEPDNSEVIERETLLALGPEQKINQIEAMSNGTGRIYQIISLEGNTALVTEKINLLETLLIGRPRVWLILSFTKDPQKIILKKMSEKFQIALQQPFRNIEIYLFKRKRPA